MPARMEESGGNLSSEKKRGNYPISAPGIWEITPANFVCVNCGKKVIKEIRVYDPELLSRQSNVVSSAMKENDAGWIPNCLNCLSKHPFLKPAWLSIN